MDKLTKARTAIAKTRERADKALECQSHEQRAAKLRSPISVFANALPFLPEDERPAIVTQAAGWALIAFVPDQVMRLTEWAFKPGVKGPYAALARGIRRKMLDEIEERRKSLYEAGMEAKRLEIFGRRKCG